MALPRPFVTKTFTVYAGDVWSTKLAFAVSVTDQFTGETPVGQLIVRVKDDDQRKPVKNPSGYYCFTDLPPGKYTVVVEPNQVTADWYFPEETVFEVKAQPPVVLNPVVEITLKPKPTYPFPGNATLVRAVVRTSNKEPVADAAVTVRERSEQAQTDANGEFVLYFKFKEKPPDKVTLDINKKNGSTSVDADIKEGETTALETIEDFPNADKSPPSKLRASVQKKSPQRKKKPI